MEQVDVDKVLTELKGVAATASNEEEFKINAERILYDEVISKFGLKPGRYEYTFISGGRADALYGHVIIEYKAPGKLSRRTDIAKAKEQLIEYIKKEAEVEERYKHFLGVILSDRIAFVRYDLKTKDWVMRGPYELNRETVLRLIEAIRGLRRKKLAVDELLRDFGPKSLTARKAIRVFYNKVTRSKSPKVKALFNDWKRLFSQVCAYSPEKLKGLEAEYGISGQVDYNALLFSIHTYYAFIMKLLGAEVAYLYGAGRWLKSYVSELEDAYMKGLDSLKRSLEELESGGVFRKLLNITNFIEGDYFSWYLEELDDETAEVIAEIAKKLVDYEPATPVLEPEYTRDLLKRLYQNLVPKKIRHDLGEYYTPDWLAELVLNEVGLTVENFEKLAKDKNDMLAPLNLRVLDPACGSGTFLILTIKRFREYAEEHYLNDILAEYLLKNVVGFDLNPLAVLAARTNYLLAIADLLPYVKDSIEIPVYLADSLLVETRTTLTGTTYVIRTSVGEFQIPKSIVKKGLLGKILEAIDRYVKLRYRVEDFKKVVKDELNLDERELQSTGDLYRVFLRLEKEGKNHVWTSIIRNAFAPLTIISSYGKFDFIIGNPPWVNWENLPAGYLEHLKPLFQYYNILPPHSLSTAKIDISMLFVYRCMDRYLIDNGLLGFLITQSVFKSIAGGGFRRFSIRGRPICVLKVHDMVELEPFEDAKNKTTVLIIKKGCKTEYPIQYIVWRKERGRIDQTLSLNDIKGITKIEKMWAGPFAGKHELPWLILPSKVHFQVLKKILGVNLYEFHSGVDHNLVNVYCVNIQEARGENLIIENIPLFNRKRTKKVKKISYKIEKKYVYPYLRGKNVKKWKITYENYIILPHDPSGKVIPEDRLKIEGSRCYAYFKEFENQLKDRSTYKLMGKGKPFYSVFKIGKYTFSKYKVLFGRKSKEIAAAVAEPVCDKYLGETLMIPDYDLILIPCNDEAEAHYLCAILNSHIINYFINACVMQVFPNISMELLKHFKLLKYNKRNAIHQKLSRLSKKAHELIIRGAKNELIMVEEEIDKTVAQLYGITDDELREIKRYLAILRGEEVEKEEVEEEPKEIKVDFLNAVVRPNTIGSFEVAVSNPLKDKVVIELQLPDRLVRLETDKEEESFMVKVPRLEAGEYKIPYKITTSKGVTEGSFTLYVKEEERRRAREALRSKLDELLGD